MRPKLATLERRQQRWAYSARRQPPGLALRSARVTNTFILNFEHKPQLNQMASIAFGVARSVITDMIFPKPLADVPPPPFLPLPSSP